jgi:hypothetical protein
LVLWALPVQAQSDATRAAAHDMGAEGVEDYQAGNYAAASDKLGRAFNILRVPTLGLWSARALAKEGKLIEASERYLAVTRLDATKGDVALQRQAQADAASEREALQARIPALTVEVKGASSELNVTLDGQPVPADLLGFRQPVNPGKHVLEARDATRQVRKDVTVNEAQRQSVTLDLTSGTAVSAAPASAPAADGPAMASASAPPASAPGADAGRGRPVPAGVWVGVAIAGAGVLTGGVTAVLAAQKKSDLDCPEDHCLTSQQDDVDAHNRLLTISTIGFVAAGVGLATAGVFWFSRPKEAEHSAHVTPWVGLGAAGVRGTF